MEFKNLQNNEVISKDTKESIIKINNVEIHLKNSDNYITTINDLINLSKREPNAIMFMRPPLYSAFKSTVDNSIETYVNVGDDVKYRKTTHIPEGEEVGLTHKVKQLELSAIGSISVFTARLSNGDMCLASYLLKV